jgi:hypothetical protein
MKKHSTGDEEIFHFLLTSLKADAKLRTHDIVGNFSMGGIKCTHLLATSHDGSPIRILETSAESQNDESLLVMTYTDVKKSSPDFETVHQSVLKRINVKFKSVLVTVHQVTFSHLSLF